MARVAHLFEKQRTYKLSKSSRQIGKWCIYKVKAIDYYIYVVFISRTFFLQELLWVKLIDFVRVYHVTDYTIDLHGDYSFDTETVCCKVCTVNKLIVQHYTVLWNVICINSSPDHGFLVLGSGSQQGHIEPLKAPLVWVMRLALHLLYTVAGVKMDQLALFSNTNISWLYLKWVLWNRDYNGTGIFFHLNGKYISTAC